LGKARYTLADVRDMLAHCAPDAELVLKKHRYWAIRGAITYTQFPKGEGAGGEKLSRIRVEDGRIRACVAMLGISVECAGKFLPGIFKQEQEADTQ